MKKIAFCFLIYDKINLEEYWNYFFDKVDKNKYNIYIHYKYNAPLLFFNDYKLNNCIPTNYEDITITKAINLMLEEGLKDPDNSHFILLTGSCIPVKSFDYIYKKIFSFTSNGFLIYLLKILKQYNGRTYFKRNVCLE